MTTEVTTFRYDGKRGLTGTVRFPLEDGGCLVTEVSLPSWRSEVSEAIGRLKELLAEDVSTRLNAEKRPARRRAS